jgi:hypothetical protein
VSKLFATAGSKLYIGGAKAFAGTDFVASDFNGQSWTEIGGATNLGRSGDTSELITSNHIGEDRTRKLKGTRNAGAMQVVCDLDFADAGQLALVAAEKAKESYACKLVFNDAPPGGTPSVRYFVALVMSVEESHDEANSVTALNATLEIDGNIVRVSAAATGSAPDNTVLPTISGTAETDETLTASTGTWTGTPTPAFTYRWFRDSETILGATADTYVVVAADEGHKLRVEVTATNVNGTASALSTETATVTAGS